VRQQQNHTTDPWPSGGLSALDALRIEQFLAFQRDVLLAGGDPATLGERLVQWVTILLGIRGALVSVVADGAYRVLGAYGVGRTYRDRYDGASLGDAEIGAALSAGRPVTVHDVDNAAPVRTVVLPFGVGEASGALHLVLAENAPLPDHEVALARALAEISAVALANAQRCSRLAQLATLKGEALTTMAHDLRSPLNALVGYSSLLAEGAFGTLSVEQRDIARTLERQALDLVDLFGATLDVARLETGRLPLRVEPFLLADVTGVLAAGTFARATGEGRLTWSVPVDLPPLRSDRVKVKEIVQNLVDNALKHGAGAAVAVEVDVAAAHRALRITVRDGGRGIPPDVLPHLFEPSRPGAGGGTGFGLYIVRCFTEALGGRVAASSDGSGTSVTVELPIETSAR
jgi:signal transduction histidine kinase